MQICVKSGSSLDFIELLSLLSERGVDLEKTDFVIHQPLNYVYEHVGVFFNEVIIVLLTEVSELRALKALNKVKNISLRKELRNAISLRRSLLNPEKKEEVLKSRKRKLLEDPLEGTSSDIRSSLKDLLEGASSKEVSKELLKSSAIFANCLKGSQVFLLVDLSKVHVSGDHPTDNCEEIDFILQGIKNNDFRSFEEILSDPSRLESLDYKIKELFSEEETLFSVLFERVRDPIYRHVICFLFLQYGFSTEKIVFRNENMITFLCSYRSNFPIRTADKSILLQTIFLIMLLTKNYDLRKLVIESICRSSDQVKLSEYFINEDGFCKKNQSIFNKMPLNYVTIPFYFSYLEASLITRKDPLSEEDWEINKVYLGKTFFYQITMALCTFYRGSYSISTTQRKQSLLFIFECLLRLGSDPNCLVYITKIPSSCITNAIKCSCRDDNIRNTIMKLLKIYFDKDIDS